MCSKKVNDHQTNCETFIKLEAGPCDITYIMLVMLPTVMLLVAVMLNYLDLDFEKVLSLKEVGQPSGRL